MSHGEILRQLQEERGELTKKIRSELDWIKRVCDDVPGSIMRTQDQIETVLGGAERLRALQNRLRLCVAKIDLLLLLDSTGA